MSLEFELRRVIADVVREVVREELKSAFSERAATAPPAEPGYITVRKAAELACVHPATVRGWIHEGKLPSYRAGRLPRLKVSDFDAFLRTASQPREEIDIEEQARRILAEAAASDARRRARCSHSPQKHYGGYGTCRVRKCVCDRCQAPGAGARTP